jgi:hypothetical protein
VVETTPFSLRKHDAHSQHRHLIGEQDFRRFATTSGVGASEEDHSSWRREGFIRPSLLFLLNRLHNLIVLLLWRILEDLDFAE